jgi:membrane fusion protein (multidrug efflux system)
MRSQLCRRLSPASLLLVTLLPMACRRPAVPEEEVRPAPVEAVAARSLFLGEWTDLVGTTQPLPLRVARITAAIEGQVTSVLGAGTDKPITEGQQVTAGDVIAQLNTRLALANRDRLMATQKDLDEQVAQANIAQQIAEVKLSRLEDLRRRSTGSSSGDRIVSQVELEDARLAIKDAESKQRGAVARLDVAKKELKALEEQLELYTLRAPIAGRLGLIQIVPGQTLSVGTTVAEITDLSEIEVLCYVAPHTAAQLGVDQTARLATNTGEEEPSAPPGKVVFIAPSAQPDTGNFAVKVRFPNPRQLLRANTIKRVQVLTQPEKERVTIPETALMEDSDPPSVVVVENLQTKKNAEDKEEKLGKARVLRARVGVRDRRWHVVEILGLEDPEKKEKVPLEDALFVVKGGHGLRTDDPVKLEEEEE